MTTSDIHLYRSLHKHEIQDFELYIQSFIYNIIQNEISFDYDFEFDESKLMIKLFSKNKNWFYHIELLDTYLMCTSNFLFKNMENEQILKNTVIQLIRELNDKFEKLFLISE